MPAAGVVAYSLSYGCVLVGSVKVPDPRPVRGRYELVAVLSWLRWKPALGWHPTATIVLPPVDGALVMPGGAGITDYSGNRS